MEDADRHLQELIYAEPTDTRGYQIGIFFGCGRKGRLDG